MDNILKLDFKKPLVNLTTDIVFSQYTRGYANACLKMDILKPQSEKSLPALVFIPGGGFVSSNKDAYIQQKLKIAESGYIVASIEYRTIPDCVFPEPLQDVKSAIRYLRAHAKRFNIDKENIAVMGNSAGGYLAALVGVTNGVEEFDRGDYLNEKSDVKASIDIYGLSDLTSIGYGYSEIDQKAHKSPAAPEALWVHGIPIRTRQLGLGINDDLEKADKANPITYISKNSTPFLLMHGSKDSLVSPYQTKIFHDALIKEGIESIRYVVEGAEHGGTHWVQPEIINIIIEFLNKHLKK